MRRDNLNLIIADSSRLGTRMLEKILAPLVDVTLCRDPGQLETALASEPAPRLCLISHQWPGLEAWLASDRRQRPGVVLLASPDSDAKRLAHLCEDHDAGILYRPYEPAQVMREVLHRTALNGPQPVRPAPADTPRQTTDPAPEKHEPDGAALLARDRAFCKRHGLPHSVVAIRIQDHGGLVRELGSDVVTKAEESMFEALQQRLRQEDGIVLREPGRMALTLPGTPPLGARVLAHRLCAWLQKAEFEINDFHIHFTIAVGIHCLDSESAESAESALEEAQSACLVAHANHRSSAVHLSDLASELAIHHHAQPDETAEEEDTPETEPAESPAAPATDPETLWQNVENVLQESRSDGDSAREAVMKKLTGVLRHLDENERMALVDELLLASALPES